MVHYLKIKGKEIKVVMYCNNDDIENNICSTSNGDCKNCPYGQAEVSIKDILELQD
jgi:hypothetical protein